MTTLIDWHKVNELCGEVGPEDFDEVVELFLDEVEEALESLGGADRNLEHDLHFLKGAALNLGFAQFSDVCKEGEQAAAEGAPETVDVGNIRQSYAASRAVFLSDLSDKLAS